MKNIYVRNNCKRDNRIQNNIVRKQEQNCSLNIRQQMEQKSD